MNVEVHLDPFAPPSVATPTPPELEAAWFDSRRAAPSSRPFPCARPSAPPPPIDDPVADPWFR